MISTQSLVLLCSLVFFGGLVDSIAGGGGIITIPAYFLVGLPAHNAIGCNKFSAASGTTFSTLRFLKNKAMDWQVALVSAGASFTASYITSRLALSIDEKLLKTIVIFALPIIAILLMLKRDYGRENTSGEIPRKRAYMIAFFIGFFIGLYDGFIGPGAGTFAIIAYAIFMKYDLKTASGNTKVLNLASNYASVIAYFMSGKIIYSIAIPAAIFGIAGNYIGAGLAIKKGTNFIRPIMVSVMIAIFGKLFYDMFGDKIVSIFI